MQTLSTYRKAHGLNQKAFAAMVGTDQSIISRIETGEMTPTLILAAEIERVTGGAVPAVSWVHRLSPSAPSSEGSQPGDSLPDNKGLGGSGKAQGMVCHTSEGAE